MQSDDVEQGFADIMPRRSVLTGVAGLAALTLRADAQGKGKGRSKGKGKQHKRRKQRRQAALPTRTSTAAEPDILVFVTDDMRADDWPILRQAQQRIAGTWFSNFCYDVAVCGATRATLLTGQHAHTHGVLDNGRSDQLFRPHEAESLAPAMQAAGYHTAYTGKYLNEYKAGRIPPGWNDWRAVEMKDDTYVTGGKYATNVLTERATDAVRAAPSQQPLFLIVSYHAPHVPHIPARRYRKADVGPARNGMDRERKRCLLSVDDSIAAIADAMGERWQSAVVLAMSDNGYLLGEHGTEGKAIWWDQAERVPLLARLQPGSATSDERMTSTIDVCPTLLSAAGATAWWPMQGKALQEDWDRDEVLIAGYQGESSGENRTPFFGLKGRGWVYVEPQGKPARYFADPGELEDVIDTIDAAAYAARLAALRSG